MRGFIAGATSVGPRCASAASVRTLSASPCASFAIVFAVAGATPEVGALEVRVPGLAARPPRERLEVSRRTNRSAPGVTSGTTSCPAWTSSRTSSHAL